MATMINGTEMYRDAIRRIEELEKLNTALAEQVDRMRPVTNAAWAWRLSNAAPARAVVLSETVDEYEQQMAQLAREGG